MRQTLAIGLILLFGMAGCTDKVGEPEFICPVCDYNEARIYQPWGHEIHFYFYCGSCGTESGYYKSLSVALKIWKLSSKGDTK